MIDATLVDAFVIRKRERQLSRESSSLRRITLQD